MSTNRKETLECAIIFCRIPGFGCSFFKLTESLRRRPTAEGAYPAALRSIALTTQGNLAAAPRICRKNTAFGSASCCSADGKVAAEAGKGAF